MSEARTIGIASNRLSAEIGTLGAELRRLRDAEGRDLLWDGDPAFWTGRAPVLFPVIGCVAGGVIRVDGQAYPMPKHGFARSREWAVVEEAPDRVVFRLEADAATRASYPFAFRLDFAFAIQGATLAMQATLANTDTRPLPASFGFHPALRWPLPGGLPRGEQSVVFAEEEPAPIRRIGADGLLRTEAEPTPVEGRTLHLADALFVDDALIFDRSRSRALVYGDAARSVAVEFPDMPQLGIWTKPGAGYLCIEPWAGIADPEDFSGELADKPGIVMVAPGDARGFTMRLTFA